MAFEAMNPEGRHPKVSRSDILSRRDWSRAALCHARVIARSFAQGQQPVLEVR
jgi:hypothetical protein